MKSEKKSLIKTVVLLFVIAFLFGLYLNVFKVRGEVVGLVSGSVYYITLMMMLFYTVKVVEKKSFLSIGFDFNGIAKKILLGIGIFAILGTVFNLYYFIVFGLKPDLIHLSLSQTIIRTIYMIFVVGFVEELIFRGYLLQRLNEITNSKVYAVLLSSVIFALWHYPVKHYFGQVIFAFFFGIILSIIRVKAKENIIISLAIGHGLYNSFIYIAGYFIK